MSHRTILEKLLEHEHKILRNSELIQGVARDVHEVKEELTPINDGIRSMVLLFKIAIAVGAISAAFLGVAELWTTINGV